MEDRKEVGALCHHNYNWKQRFVQRGWLLRKEYMKMGHCCVLEVERKNGKSFVRQL